MSETVTLTPEELKQFQDLREEIYGTISILGDLNYKKTLLGFEIENLSNVIKQNAIKEKELLSALGLKYGDGSINIETGEIKPLQ